MQRVGGAKRFGLLMTCADAVQRMVNPWIRRQSGIRFVVWLHSASQMPLAPRQEALPPLGSSKLLRLAPTRCDMPKLSFPCAAPCAVPAAHGLRNGCSMWHISLQQIMHISLQQIC